MLHTSQAVWTGFPPREQEMEEMKWSRLFGLVLSVLSAPWPPKIWTVSKPLNRKCDKTQQAGMDYGSGYPQVLNLHKKQHTVTALKYELTAP